jgi:hypothetical protein
MIRNILSVFAFFSVLFIIASCSPSADNATTPSTSDEVCTTSGTATAAAVNTKTLPITGTEANAVPLTVGCGYQNMPCVSVKICNPGSAGTTGCQIISNLLLDTGSYGLRIFNNSTTNLGTLTTATLGSTGKSECVSYFDGTYQWGQVRTADVVLGSKVAGSVPIMVIEANPTTDIPNVPSACVNQQGFAGTADTSSPGSYNGILGVGLFAEDCGVGCATVANNKQYFNCTGNVCTQGTIAISQQVTNPVAKMPAGFNNGVALQLNNVSGTGAVSSTGYMVLGIGSVANNTPGGSVALFQADTYGNSVATYGGTQYLSFIDSGSNWWYFPNGCLAETGGLFTPASQVGFTATFSSYDGSNPTSIPFNIYNPIPVVNNVYNNVGVDTPDVFIFGLPFFLGRTIYVGITAKSSPLGTGPYWGY